MSYDEPIRVLIAHGNPLVATGLEAAFAPRTDFRVVAPCAPERLSGAASGLGSAGVAVTDYDAGIRLMSADRGGGCRVLIVTGNDSEVSIRRALELGTKGYLPLSSSVEAVIRAVQSIHRGGTVIDPAALTKIAVSLTSPTLTCREMEVLRLMMQGLPNKAIATSLQRSVATAKAHVKAILGKLDAASRVEAVAVARRRGLVPDETIAIPWKREATRSGRELAA